MLANSDLVFWRGGGEETLTEEQTERKEILFRVLVSLFENANMTLNWEDMGADARRRPLVWDRRDAGMVPEA